jgi:hypothetical protein
MQSSANTRPETFQYAGRTYSVSKVFQKKVLWKMNGTWRKEPSWKTKCRWENNISRSYRYRMGWSAFDSFGFIKYPMVGSCKNGSGNSVLQTSVVMLSVWGSTSLLKRAVLDIFIYFLTGFLRWLKKLNGQILCFVDRASRYMRVMKPTWCTIYLQFIQSLYLYVFWAC